MQQNFDLVQHINKIFDQENPTDYFSNIICGKATQIIHQTEIKNGTYRLNQDNDNDKDEDEDEDIPIQENQDGLDRINQDQNQENEYKNQENQEIDAFLIALKKIQTPIAQSALLQCAVSYFQVCFAQQFTRKKQTCENFQSFKSAFMKVQILVSWKQVQNFFLPTAVAVNLKLKHQIYQIKNNMMNILNFDSVTLRSNSSIQDESTTQDSIPDYFDYMQANTYTDVGRFCEITSWWNIFWLSAVKEIEPDYDEVYPAVLTTAMKHQQMICYIKNEILATKRDKERPKPQAIKIRSKRHRILHLLMDVVVCLMYHIIINVLKIPTKRLLKPLHPKHVIVLGILLKSTLQTTAKCVFGLDSDHWKRTQLSQLFYLWELFEDSSVTAPFAAVVVGFIFFAARWDQYWRDYQRYTTIISLKYASSHLHGRNFADKMKAFCPTIFSTNWHQVLEVSMYSIIAEVISDASWWNDFKYDQQVDVFNKTSVADYIKCIRKYYLDNIHNAEPVVIKEKYLINWQQGILSQVEPAHYKMASISLIGNNDDNGDDILVQQKQGLENKNIPQQQPQRGREHNIDRSRTNADNGRSPSRSERSRSRNDNDNNEYDNNEYDINNNNDEYGINNNNDEYDNNNNNNDEYDNNNNNNDEY
eukprot:164975_1